MKRANERRKQGLPLDRWELRLLSEASKAKVAAEASMEVQGPKGKHQWRFGRKGAGSFCRKEALRRRRYTNASVLSNEDRTILMNGFLRDLRTLLRSSAPGFVYTGNDAGRFDLATASVLMKWAGRCGCRDVRLRAQGQFDAPASMP